MFLRTSDIRTAQRCMKRFEYSFVRGWQPRVEPSSWREGTWIHEWLKYRYLTLKGESPPEPAPPEDPIDLERYTNARAVVDYYWMEVGQHDQFDEIISVEQPTDVQVGRHVVRATFDLVVRQDGRIVVYDHKTTSSIPETLSFLQVDTQVLTYLLCVFKTYGEEADFVYNVIRRKVPPSDPKSRASRNPVDYLKRIRIWKSSDELRVYEKELVGFLDRLEQETHFYRSPIKNGGDACSFCPYLAVCAAELSGQAVDDSTARLLFEIKHEEVAA